MQIEDKYLKTKTTDIQEAMAQSIIPKAKEALTFVRSQNAYAVCLNQLGYNMRCFVINTKKLGWEQDIIINPSFEAKKGSKIVNSIEYCLSFPGKRFKIRRYKVIYAKYYDYMKCKYITKKLQGMDSIMFQHEVSHLNGIPEM
jgi:peptide deformylase